LIVDRGPGGGVLAADEEPVLAADDDRADDALGPEAISALVLKKLMRDAEAATGAAWCGSVGPGGGRARVRAAGAGAWR